MRKVLFYVSGHGYGHATRSAEVIRELAAADPSAQLYVRTAVPEHIFTASAAPARYSRVTIDAGAVERQAGLEIDPRATLERLAAVCQSSAGLIAHEAAFVRREGIELIVADIPPLAGDIAAEAGVESVGIGNFLWSWTYEPYFAECPEFGGMLDSLRESYRKMRRFIRLPFGQTDSVEMFEQVIDAPLISRRSRRPPGEIREQLGIGRETRPIVFLAMRGALAAEAIERAASSGDFLVIYLEADGRVSSPHALFATLDDTLHHSDLMSVSDVVVSKAGYGIVSECVAAGKRLLYPRRVNFREDSVLLPEAARYIRMGEIAREDFLAGNWTAAVRKLLATTGPLEAARVDGAEFCARLLMPGALQTFTL